MFKMNSSKSKKSMQRSGTEATRTQLVNNHNYQVVNEMFDTQFVITKLINFFEKLTPTFFNSQQIGLELIIVLVPAIPYLLESFLYGIVVLFLMFMTQYSRGIKVS